MNFKEAYEEMLKGKKVRRPGWEGAEPQFLGDDYYIIRGIKGEAYPCEGSVFRDSYEEKK